MMGSQVLIAILGIFCGVVQAAYVSPEILGFFSAFAILGGYLTFLHMGTLTALHRDFPYWLGRGDSAKANDSAAIAQGWILLICAFLAVLYAVLVVVNLVQGRYMAAGGWAANLVVASLFNYTLYLGCTYRTNSEFVRWAQLTLVASVASTAALPLVIWWGYWGLCLRLGLPALLTVWLMHRFRPVRVRPRWNVRDLWKMVKFGLPMDTAGYFSTSCMVATMSSIVLAKYGAATLGLFAFARYAEAVMQQFALSFAQVFVPRINYQMGVTENLRHCVRYSVKPTLLGVGVVALAIVAGFMVARPLIGWATPKYIDAVPMFQVLLLVGLYPVLMIPGQALIAAKVVLPATVAHLVCYGAFVVLAMGFIWASLPPVWVAVAYVAGKLSAVIICYTAVFWRTRLRPAETTGQSVGPVAIGVPARTDMGQAATFEGGMS